MITIKLFCQHGATTKMLVAKMDEYAKAKGYECDIQAASYASVGESAAGADVLLLAPQVRFKYDALVKEYPDKTVMVVDTTEYGMMAGDKVVEKVMKEFNGKR